jgi:hypothetical protein
MQGEHNAKHNANTMQPNANNCLANALYMVCAYIYIWPGPAVGVPLGYILKKMKKTNNES